MNEAVIFGYYGKGNLGDETNLQCLVGYLNAHFSNIKISVITADPIGTLEKLGSGIQVIGKNDFPAILRVFKKADCLIGGGGSLFQDSTSRRSVFYYATLIFLARFFKLRIILYGQGIGPVQTISGKCLVGMALSMVDVVTVRDRLSVIALANLHVRKPEIHFTADPLLQLSAVSPEKITAFWQNYAISKPRRVGLIVREIPQKKNDFWYQMLDSLKWDNNLEIYIMIMEPADIRIGTEIASNYGLELFEVNDWEKLQSIIGGMSFVWSSRLHGLIAAVNQGISCCGLALDPKIDGFCLPLAIPYLAVDPDLDRITLSARITNALTTKQTWFSQIDFWKVRSMENQIILKQFILNGLPYPFNLDPASK